MDISVKLPETENEPVIRKEENIADIKLLNRNGHVEERSDSKTPVDVLKGQDMKAYKKINSSESMPDLRLLQPKLVRKNKSTEVV
jgi:hypothetical protein